MAWLQSLLLLLGGAGFGVLSIWIPWLSREDGSFVLSPAPGIVATTLSNITVLVVLGACVLAGVMMLVSLVRDLRVRRAIGWSLSWAKRHPILTLVLLLFFVLGSVDVYELLYDPFNMKWGPDGNGGLRKWMIREDLQVWLAFAAAVCGMLAASALFPPRDASAALLCSLKGKCSCRLGWVLAFTVPVVMGVAMCVGALDGIPHFSDALTYLMQGRTVMSGRLSVPTPEHYDLFQHTLFYVESDGRFFGKYPLAWPVIVGFFDAMSVGYLANALLAGLLAVLTGKVAQQFASKRVAVIAALLVGVSPWVWFHAASFASHVTSACAAMGFLWMFLSLLGETEDSEKESGSLRDLPLSGAALRALVAGLCLGVGVLTRPQDALMFALPAVLVTFIRFAKQPKRWIVLGPMICVGALAGVAVYLWINQHTTGQATLPPYKLEDRWEKDWNPTIGSVLARVGWYISELNGRFPGWGVGGITLGVMGAYAAGSAWRKTGLRIVAASTVLFFVGCAAFGFTNVWWGPRWLLPAVPLLAILTAYLVDAAIGVIAGGTAPVPRPHAAVSDDQSPDAGHGRMRPWHPDVANTRAAAMLLICILLAGIDVSLLFRWGGQCYAHRLFPPHTVSAAAWDEVQKQGLSNAVLAMPTSGDRAPLDARAGMVFMTVPFEQNSVIVVRAVDDWQHKAHGMYPDRRLYELVPDNKALNKFVIRELRQPEVEGLE